jgi:hypothetical protein
MAGKNTRAEYFEKSNKALRSLDYLAAFALLAAGIVAPLAAPISDLQERWRKS